VENDLPESQPASEPKPAVRAPGPRLGLVAARVAAAAALIATAAVVLQPFLTALAWGAILAYATWPIYRRLPGRARRPKLWAAVLTAGVAVGIGIPVALLLVALADDVTALGRAVLSWRETGVPLSPALTENALVQRILSFFRAAPLDPGSVEDWLGRAASELSQRAVAVAGGVVRNALRFGVAMISLYSFYLSGERLIQIGRRLAPLLFPIAPARFLESVGDSVRAVIFGLLGTALVQGILTGIGLAVAGVSSPVALGAVAALISVLPGGAGAVSVAAAAWLALSGRWIAAAGLALWGLLVVGSMDNLLRPLLISERGRIPFLVVFVGIIGGLASFGLIGIFLGPVVLSVSFALTTEFSRLAPDSPDDALGA